MVSQTSCHLKAGISKRLLLAKMVGETWPQATMNILSEHADVRILAESPCVENLQHDLNSALSSNHNAAFQKWNAISECKGTVWRNQISLVCF